MRNKRWNPATRHTVLGEPGNDAWLRSKGQPLHFSRDGTDTGIQMRATDRGRDDSLVAMVFGDRQDADIMLKLVRHRSRRTRGVDTQPPGV